jgi:hypothetical protein
MTDFLIDRNLYEIKKITDELRKYYFGQAQNAVVAALKSAKRQFVSKTK